MLTAMATAEEQKAVGPKAKDKIVISATKTDNSLEEESIVIGVVTREQMDKHQVRDLGEAVKRMPGVTIYNGPRSQSMRPIIRGLSDARVLTVIDGVRQNFDSSYRGKMYVDFDLLKQVEVVRGPASALWGSGALGGVLSLETVDPSDLLDDDKEWGLKLSSGFDSVNDGIRFGSTVFGRADQFEYLFNVGQRDSNDVTLGSGDRLKYSEQDNYSSLSKLIWHASKNDKLTLQYQTHYADELKPLDEQRSTEALSGITDQEAKRDQVKFGYEHDDVNDNFDFTFNAYYTSLELDDEYQDRATAGWTNSNTQYDTYGVELRNSTIWAQSDNIVHTFTYGIELFRDEQEASRDGGEYFVFPDAEQDSLGIYIQDEIAIGEKLVVIPGIRYDEFDSESDAGESLNADSVNPKLGIIYHLNDDIDLFANYSHGMRGPTLRELYIQGGGFPEFLSNPDLEEEKSKNWDVGFRLDKSNAFTNNDNLKLRYAFFHNEIEDYINLESDITYHPIFGFPTAIDLQYQNVSDATIHGHELEAEWSNEKLLLWANYTYTHGENDTDNEPLSGIPSQTVNFGVDYQVVNDISVGYAGQFVDHQDRLGSVDIKGTDNYSTHDVYVRWAPSSDLLNGLALTVGIDNILDEEYQSHMDVVEGEGQNVKASLSYTVQF